MDAVIAVTVLQTVASIRDNYIKTIMNNTCSQKETEQEQNEYTSRYDVIDTVKAQNPYGNIVKRNFRGNNAISQ